METEPGAALWSRRTRRHSSQDDPGSDTRISHRFHLARRGKSLDRRDRRGTRLERPRRQIQIAACTFATARAAQPLFQAEERGAQAVTCTDFLSQLTDYFDGQIDPDLLAEVQTHVRECHHCEVVLDTTRQTISIYREHEIYEFPAELRERLHAAIMKKCTGAR